MQQGELSQVKESLEMIEMQSFTNKLGRELSYGQKRLIEMPIHLSTTTK